MQLLQVWIEKRLLGQKGTLHNKKWGQPAPCSVTCHDKHHTPVSEHGKWLTGQKLGHTHFKVLRRSFYRTLSYLHSITPDCGEYFRDQKLGHAHFKVLWQFFEHLYLSNHWTEPFHIWNIIVSYHNLTSHIIIIPQGQTLERVLVVFKHNLSFPNTIPQSLTLELILGVKN